MTELNGFLDLTMWFGVHINSVTNVLQLSFSDHVSHTTASRTSLILRIYTGTSCQDRFQLWFDDPMRNPFFTYVII